MKCPCCGDYVWRDESLALTWFNHTYYVCSMRCKDVWARILLGHHNLREEDVRDDRQTESRDLPVRDAA